MIHGGHATMTQLRKEHQTNSQQRARLPAIGRGEQLTDTTRAHTPVPSGIPVYPL